MATLVEGTCCICGSHGKLSFEHVPPKQAFNDHGVFEADVMKMPFMSPPFGGSARIWRRENFKNSAISWLLFASIVSVGIGASSRQGPRATARKRISQRGAGRYTLCER